MDKNSTEEPSPTPAWKLWLQLAGLIGVPVLILLALKFFVIKK